MTDRTPISDDILIMLGAYVDGALTQEERTIVEDMTEKDPRISEELEGLLELNTDLQDVFDGFLAKPVPAEIVASARPLPAASNTNKAPMRALAASLLIGAALGAGGMWFNQQNKPPEQIAAARSWLGEVAEYHQVYAVQTRHLVEVPASEQDHIEKWLSKEVGVAFKVPDLETAGWSFQGARLLVAAGKPVAQLMYKNADGAVIAICGLKNMSGTPARTALKQFGDVHMATWKSETGSFAIVGDAPEELEALADLATPLI
ncbi:hypothetical protein [Planktotalea sp.]|uniref:hypothetical protein n=1 Tax=Planktotalea sp. TaxID=2029877 RepID=UPI003F6BE981